MTMLPHLTEQTHHDRSFGAVTEIDDMRLRPETDGDLPFLQSLYASTRAEEMAQVAWDDAQKNSFLAMQFTLQRRYYREHFPDARFDIIEDGGQSIGRRYLWRHDRGINLIDMALMPAWRGQGRGAAILRSIQHEARALGGSVTLYVEHHNPAIRLYQRFGFEEIASNGIYRQLRWPSSPSIAHPA